MTTTPAHFETSYQALWDGLDEQLAAIRQGEQVDGALLAARYRRVCEHLALARSRAYPPHLTARLEALAQQAHPLIYRRQDYGLAALARLLRHELPRGVRAQWRWVALSAALFVLPLALAFVLTLQGPDFALRLLDAAQLRQFEAMYADGRRAVGRLREAGDDWQMFGFYILNNVGIAFRAFGAGVLAGIGSAAVLVYNGLNIGAVAGHLTRAGLGHNFWPFVATHSSFELTGVVLSGAGGLRLGMAWLMPGRRTRLDGLRHGALQALPLLYAAFALLIVAAVFEAFWSSAAWIAPAVKYTVAGICWLLVAAWLLGMGRSSTSQRGSGHAR